MIECDCLNKRTKPILRKIRQYPFGEVCKVQIQFLPFLQAWLRRYHIAQSLCKFGAGIQFPQCFYPTSRRFARSIEKEHRARLPRCVFSLIAYNRFQHLQALFQNGFSRCGEISERIEEHYTLVVAYQVHTDFCRKARAMQSPLRFDDCFLCHMRRFSAECARAVHKKVDICCLFHGKFSFMNENRKSTRQKIPCAMLVWGIEAIPPTPDI